MDDDSHPETSVIDAADAVNVAEKNEGGDSDHSDLNQNGEQSQCPEPGLELERLVPSALTSNEKLVKVQDSSQLVFSGRFAAATLCELLGTLEEADLRSLREHLHSALPDAIPATAGRQLARSNAGSSVRLVEDCWALGYSVVNGVLTSRANSVTLRPAGRTPLEPPPPPFSNTAAITSSMDSLLASYLRLESSFSGQQRDIANIRAEVAELRNLRKEFADLHELRDNVAELRTLREEVAELHELRDNLAELRAVLVDRDARITHLEAQVAELLSLAGAASRRPAGPSETGHLASEVAGQLNMQELGASIAAALRASDSDSDTSDDPHWPPPRWWMGQMAVLSAVRMRPEGTAPMIIVSQQTRAHGLMHRPRSEARDVG